MFGEALVIGLVLAGILAVIHSISMSALGEKSAMSHESLAMQAFIGGFLIHIICEYLNLNKWFCTKNEW